MRTFASTLALGRGARSDNNTSPTTTSAHSTPPVAHRPAKTRSPSFFAKAPKTPVETATAVLSRPALTPGSSCSSDGSASVQTPEDETMMPPYPKSDEKKRWSTWFAWRKQSDKDTVEHPEETITSPPRVVSTSKSDGGKHGPSLRVPRQSSSDTDGDEESSSDSSLCPESSTVIPARAFPPRATIVQARANLRTLLRNTLSRPPSPPPLVDTPSMLFPRSCAVLGSSQRPLSLESSIHIRKMLWRLDHQTLSETESRSIANLARRPQPKDASRNRTEKRMEDDIISYASMRVGRYSRGLRKWASRPCFEQRFLVWMPDGKGTMGCKTVTGVERALAVCELELSEGVEALAGLAFDDETFEQNLFPLLPAPKRPNLKPMSRKQAPPHSAPRKSFQCSPSPLRLDHATPAEPVLSTVSPLSSAVSGVSASNPLPDINRSRPSTDLPHSVAPGGSRPAHLARDGVESDEGVPLAYALQAKKKREEKARFLQGEREKRAKEVAAREATERQQRDIELRRAAAEEQKRKEEEWKRMEEAKKAREERLKAKYNEEIAATRERRESARLGTESYTNIREMHQRENGEKYARPAYDTTPPPVQLPRRSASAFAVSGDAPAKSSSSNLRPVSMAESAQDKRRSVAPSSFNLSMEDVRSTSHRPQPGGTDVSQQQRQQSRPPSIASASSRPASVLRSQSAPNQVPIMAMAYPMIPVMPQLPPMPPVHGMPMWNMPLLPPNAPFMMQQYSRSASPGSNPQSRDPSPSASPSRRTSAIPPSPSRRQPHFPSSSPSPSRPHQASASSSRPSHLRYPSGDKRLPQPPTERRGSNSPATQRPSRSTSYTPLQHSASQPIRPQDSRSGSTTNVAHIESKRRTSLR